MTKDEIKTLVAAKIAGQGSQVDVGGGLPTILNEIIDLIPEGGGGGFEPLVVEGSREQGTSEIYVSGEDFLKIISRIKSGLPTFVTYPYDYSELVKGIEEIIAFDEETGLAYTKNYTVDQQ